MLDKNHLYVNSIEKNAFPLTVRMKKVLRGVLCNEGRNQVKRVAVSFAG
jgi:hypothetical protein